MLFVVLLQFPSNLRISFDVWVFSWEYWKLIDGLCYCPVVQHLMTRVWSDRIKLFCLSSGRTTTFLQNLKSLLYLFWIMVCSLWFSKVNLLSFADQFEDNTIIPTVVLPWWLDASVSNHVLSISVFGEVEDVLTDSEGIACPLTAIRFSVHVGFFPYVQRPLIFHTLCSYVIICLFTLLFHCSVWF